MKGRQKRRFKMANNDGIPTTVMEDWAQSLRWLKAHPEATRGKRALAAFVAAVVEGAQALQGQAEEAASAASDMAKQ